MCKLMVFTDLSKLKQKNLSSLVDTIAETLAEPHGFGYAIQGKDGLFGERTTDVSGFRSALSRSVPSFPFLRPTYNRIGNQSKITGSAIFHGRTSTNEKTLLNTHPIQKREWTLIHNGVVSDHGPKYDMITTNDTEHVLERFSTGGIQSVAENLTGYYAVAAFSPDGLLHVFRDNRAPLYFAEIESLGSYVFATTASSIETVAKAMKWKVSIIQPLAENHYLIYRRNELLSQETFEPRGATVYENRYAAQSLREVSTYGDYLDYSETMETRSVEPYSRDEMRFLEEMSTIDHTYTVLDYRDNRIDIDEFRSYTPDEKLCCMVIRPDGTIADPADYDTERLYSGRVG